MQVQVVDKRPPLTAVIALAKAARDPALPKWRDDMATMSAEVARKYFGALTEDSVRDGVEACVNLLSIGLLRSSDGAIEPEAWLQTMRLSGVRGVSRLAVELIKACDALPDYAVVFAAKEQGRPSILLSLLSQAANAGPVRAYSYLLREKAARAEVQLQIDLAEWLFLNTPTGRAARRDMEKFFGFAVDSPEAETAIHLILSLACGVAVSDPYSESTLMEDAPDMNPHDLKVTRLGPKLLTAARSRYETVTAKIPAALQPALVYSGKTWFERFIKPSARSVGSD